MRSPPATGSQREAAPSSHHEGNRKVQRDPSKSGTILGSVALGQLRESVMETTMVLLASGIVKFNPQYEFTISDTSNTISHLLWYTLLYQI